MSSAVPNSGVVTTLGLGQRCSSQDWLSVFGLPVSANAAGQAVPLLRLRGNLKGIQDSMEIQVAGAAQMNDLLLAVELRSQANSLAG